MTGKTKEMSKIKQLLIMHRDGVSNRSIARVLGMDKETVNNYVNKALPEGVEGLLRLEDPELGRRLHSGNAAYSDPEVVRLMFLTSRVPPEIFYKGCDGLLKLQRTTRPDLFKRACETALDYGRYRYGFIKSLVESGLAGLDNADSIVKSPTSNHANVRGKGQFN